MNKLVAYRHRSTKILVGVLAVGVWALVIQNMFPLIFGQADAAPSAPSSETLDALNVHRINIKDADGKTRFVISNAQNFPPATIRGKTYNRSIGNSAGMVFYNPNGLETGGIGTSVIQERNQAALIFDYDYQPTDGISMGIHESSDGKHWGSGFVIYDRRPYNPGPISSTQGVKRISLADNNQDAELVIYDTKERPRIRIGVGKKGDPHIQILDVSGNVVYDAAQEKSTADN